MCVKFRPGQKYQYKLCPMQILADPAAQSDETNNFLELSKTNFDLHRLLSQCKNRDAQYKFCLIQINQSLLSLHFSYNYAHYFVFTVLNIFKIKTTDFSLEYLHK